MRLPDPAFWRGRRVLVTGHTGFKGSWLCLWLQSLGAEVHGMALAPPTVPSMYDVATVHAGMKSSHIVDVRHSRDVEACVADVQPQIVFHLAAQPLVRSSYESPVETYEVNVLGVVYLLEALRRSGAPSAVVNVTSDKCYENREWVWPYRENEAVGGHDPYSSSKGCAELVTAAYRRSFLAEIGVGVASARAGNVIGGGDWARDRLVPDAFRALARGEAMDVRSPTAVRPWQHVLEPLSGYLVLAERLSIDRAEFAESWNFGPSDEDAWAVEDVLAELRVHYPALRWNTEQGPRLHEARTLRLDITKALVRLEWAPRWRLRTALKMTSEWQRAWDDKCDMNAFSLMQIECYCSRN